jgi:hypothetical protein
MISALSPPPTAATTMSVAQKVENKGAESRTHCSERLQGLRTKL